MVKAEKGGFEVFFPLPFLRNVTSLSRRAFCGFNRRLGKKSPQICNGACGRSWEEVGGGSMEARAEELRGQESLFGGDQLSGRGRGEGRGEREPRTLRARARCAPPAQPALRPLLSQPQTCCCRCCRPELTSFDFSYLRGDPRVPSKLLTSRSAFFFFFSPTPSPPSLFLGRKTEKQRGLKC